MIALLGGCNTQKEEEKRVMHDYSMYSEGLPFDDDLWTAPEFYYDQELDYSENIKAVFIRSDYNDNESYAFAYLGYPDQISDKTPAVLLLHGGGGTAYHEWVSEWTNRGFIALAIDLEGHVPLKTGKITDAPNDLYQKSQYPAPHNQNLTDDKKGLENTWLYYACKTAIIANSFLHNLANVDIYKVGVCGISWGGYIASIIGGYDDRFNYLIPLYCTINTIDSGSTLGTYHIGHPLFAPFDDPTPLSLLNTPTLILVSNNDRNQNIERASLVASSLKNGYFVAKDRFPHSHNDAYGIFESFAFAQEANSGSLTHRLKIDEDASFISLNLKEDEEIIETFIFYCEDETISPKTTWFKERRGAIAKKIEIQKPMNATYAYISITTSAALNYSTYVF